MTCSWTYPLPGCRVMMSNVPITIHYGGRGHCRVAVGKLSKGIEIRFEADWRLYPCDICTVMKCYVFILASKPLCRVESSLAICALGVGRVVSQGEMSGVVELGRSLRPRGKLRALNLTTASRAEEICSGTYLDRASILTKAIYYKLLIGWL